MIYILLFIIPFLITSCAKHEKKIGINQVFWTESGMELHKQNKSKSVLALERMQHEHAKYTDIAVPLSARSLCYESPDNISNARGAILAFEIQSSRPAIELFYEQQMECLGWQLIAVTQGTESVLFFDKPQRICSVSLRPVQKSKEQKTVIIIAWNDKKPGNQ